MCIADLDVGIAASVKPYFSDDSFSQVEQSVWLDYRRRTWNYLSPGNHECDDEHSLVCARKYVSLLLGKTDDVILDLRLKLLDRMDEDRQMSMWQDGPGENAPSDFLVPMFLYENRISRILHELFVSPDLEKTLKDVRQAACVYMFRLFRHCRRHFSLISSVPALGCRARIHRDQCNLLAAVLGKDPESAELLAKWRARYMDGGEYVWHHDEEASFSLWAFFDVPHPRLNLNRFLLCGSCIPETIDASPKCRRYLKRIEDLDFEVLARLRDPRRRGTVKEEFVLRLLRENERIHDYLFEHKWKLPIIQLNFLDERFFYICIKEMSGLFWSRFGKEWSLIRDTRPEWVGNALDRSAFDPSVFTFGGQSKFNPIPPNYFLNARRGAYEEVVADLPFRQSWGLENGPEGELTMPPLF